MSNRHDTERPSLRSRFNDWAVIVAQSLAAVSAAAISLPPGYDALIGVAAGMAASKFWERFEAPAFVNRNHQPQTLYEVPWNEGVLVVQPRHHLHINWARPWRLRDETVDRLYRLHGYFATPDLADQYCQNASKVGVGRRLIVNEPEPLLRYMTHETVLQARLKFATTDPIDFVPQSAWSVHRHPDDASRFVASRQVLTSRGVRWEFCPRPPEGVDDTYLLKQDLSQRQDKFLDARQTDQSLDPMTETITRAWRAQSAPWRAISLDADDPRKARHWVAAQVGSAGRIEAWDPEPPNTVSTLEALQQRLSPWLAPQSAPTPAADPASIEIAQRIWQRQVWSVTGLPLGHPVMVRADHPFIRAVDVPATDDAMWRVVPQTVGDQVRWCAVRLRLAQDGNFVVQTLQRAEDSGRIWLTDTPDRLADAVALTAEPVRVVDAGVPTLLHRKPSAARIAVPDVGMDLPF